MDSVIGVKTGAEVIGSFATGDSGKPWGNEDWKLRRKR